jgi:Mg2+ and Co2+ transporter CorA
VDIPRARKSTPRKYIYGGAAALVLLVATTALARMEPAAPRLDGASVWTDTVKRGTMLREVRGPGTLVPEQVRSYFRDVDDHLTTVSERVMAFDELLNTLVDATLAKITLQQNTDMRKITSWVAIISVPTMVVGVYGMNFDYMPELKWKFGYPLIMSLVLIACLTLYRILRRNRWL